MTTCSITVLLSLLCFLSGYEARAQINHGLNQYGMGMGNNMYPYSYPGGGNYNLYPPGRFPQYPPMIPPGGYPINPPVGTATASSYAKSNHQDSGNYYGRGSISNAGGGGSAAAQGTGGLSAQSSSSSGASPQGSSATGNAHGGITNPIYG